MSRNCALWSLDGCTDPASHLDNCLSPSPSLFFLPPQPNYLFFTLRECNPELFEWVRTSDRLEFPAWGFEAPHASLILNTLFHLCTAQRSGSTERTNQDVKNWCLKLTKSSLKAKSGHIALSLCVCVSLSQTPLFSLSLSLQLLPLSPTRYSVHCNLFYFKESISKPSTKYCTKGNHQVKE